MTGGTTQPEPEARESRSRLFPDVLEKVSTIFGKHLADVLVRHRKVETLTGERNIIGRQNLVEALAHLGTLFARADELNRDEQLEQVAFLGDHLRRVMMESFEVEVYATIGAHWDEAEPKSIETTLRRHSRAADQARKARWRDHAGGGAGTFRCAVGQYRPRP